MKEKRLKLIKFLLKEPEKEHTLSDISEATGASYKTVKTVVDILEGYGFIETRRKGNYRFVTVNKDSPYVEAFQGMLKIEAEPFKEVAQEFAETLKERYEDEVSSIILFGSVARGVPTSDSDIDLAILVDSENKKEEIEKEAWSLRDKYDLNQAMQVNPLVITQEEFERELRNESLLEKRIIKEGEVVVGEKP